MAHPYQAAAGYGSPYAAGAYYPYQPYGPQQTAPGPAPASAPSPSSYSPHAMAQTQSQALPPPQPHLQPMQQPQPPSANYGHFDANSQRFPFPNPFHSDVLTQFGTPPVPPPPPPLGFPPIPFPNLNPAQFPPNVVPANPSPYPAQPSENATDDDDAYDPRYPQNIMSPRQPDQPAGGSVNRQEGGQEQNRTSLADPTVHGDNISKPSDSDNTHTASQKIPILSIVDNVPPQLLLPKDGPLQQPSSASSELPLPPAVAPAQPFQRHYENTTGPELRRLAKGALLSLGHHNIHYVDLVKEGIDQHVLTSLYGELHIDISPPVAKDSEKQTDEPAVNSSNAAPAVQESALAPAPAPAPAPSNSVDRPAPAGNPSLERKDRIAQLLAAKAARASPSRAVSDSGPASAVQSIPQNVPSNAAPVATTTVTNVAASNDTTAAQQLEAVEAVRVESVAVPAVKPTIDHVDDTPQVPPQLERRVTDGAALPAQLSSLIPGLFMTSDDPMATVDTGPAPDAVLPPAQLTPTSQKRRRSSDDVDQVPEPVSKRQNTASDLDEGEVMAIDSPSDKDASEAKASDDDTPQPPAVRPLEKLGSGSRAQLQRSQSASEVPSVAPLAQPNEAGANRPAAARVANPFGKAPVTSMTAAQITERAEMLKARFLRQRAERQKALQDGLPNLEAEVTKTRTLLAEKQNALSQVDERIQKLKDDISDLARQREAIGEEISQLEARLQDGISGQRRLSDELRKLGVEKNTPSAKGSPAPTSHPPKDSVQEVSQSSQVEKQPEAEHEIVPVAKQANVSERISEEPQPLKAQIDDHDRRDEPDYIHTNGTTPYSDVNGAVVDHDPTGDRRGGPAGDDQRQDLPAEDQAGDLPLDGHDSDGSASMSDSGSEEEDEYEPADPAAQQDMEIDDGLSDEYDPEEAPLHPAPSDVPMGVPEDSNVNSGGNATPTAAPVEAPEDGNVDSAPDDALSPGEVVESNADELSPSAEAAPINLPNGSSDVKMSNSDLPATQPATQPRWANGSVGSVRPLSNEAPNHTASFTPYQSPLNSLKAFRYNQQLNDPTADGFRSLTYSNTIDLNVPLCPTELSGVECQDPSCTEQHFRRFQLTDEQILVQMSKADDMGDQAAKDEFTRGLKELIADLRSRGVKEFEQVATELSKYRRDFFARREAL